MIRNMLRAAILIALCAAFGFTAEVSGQWEGVAEWPEGQMQITYNFKVSGETLSGTVEAVGSEFSISAGKLNGDEISFRVVDAGTGAEYVHHGKISGDTIQLTIDGPVSKAGDCPQPCQPGERPAATEVELRRLCQRTATA